MKIHKFTSSYKTVKEKGYQGQMDTRSRLFWTCTCGYEVEDNFIRNAEHEMLKHRVEKLEERVYGRN